MAAFATLPLNVRLAIIFVCGAIGGALANFAIYRFSDDSKSVGPWGKKHDDLSPRTIVDYLPIAGWWFMRRDAGTHGRCFWIRPMWIEFALGIGLAALYLFETHSQGLWPVLVRGPIPAAVTHSIFIAHAVLMILLTAAMFIDFDEWIIPDEITIPGTIIGLLISLILPSSLLPDAGLLPLIAERPWPVWFNGPWGLVIGVAIVAGWSLAILNFYWITRFGLAKAFQFMFASIIRHRSWTVPVLVTAIGSIIVVIGWCLGGANWESLLTSLLGLAFAGGLVWLVRIAGFITIRQEAMGFGDVTLMFMIGTFVGWQPGLVIFGLAPFAGGMLTLIYVAVSRNASLPFGPHLCLATMLMIVLWDRIWLPVKLQFFGMLDGWVLPFIFGGVVVLGVLLWIVRQLRILIFGPIDD